jgi:hypothetical protein
LKKILFISPHYPPSNLAAVHRPRLFAQHLPSFDWEPIILTVHEKFYEENLDWNLHKLIPANQRIEKVGAFKVTKPRFIGDIGLRGFFQLRKKAFSLIQSEKIDFVYIIVPSFYTALIGRYLHRKTGIEYGIDYVDPWVHEFPGSNKILSRHWWSTRLAKLLEPIAVKHASLITGVAEGYYQGVIERNPYLKKTCKFGAMPYGGEASDHEAVKKLNLQPYLFQKKEGVIQFVYAGAMLPKAYKPLEEIFKSLYEYSKQLNNSTTQQHIEFHFIGTGSHPNDSESYNIKPLAEKYGLWNIIVFEYPKRIPYLDVLTYLNIADGVFILGSTEPHYTPSKTYQAVLSKKPIMAVLHRDSTAVNILRTTNAGLVLDFDGESGIYTIVEQFNGFLQQFISFKNDFNPVNIDREAFNQYSAKNVTEKLVGLIEEVVK